MASEVPSGYNKVQFYADLYRSFMRRNEQTNWRENENWRMYSGINKGQWAPDQVEMLIQEKRAVHQVNFLQKKVNDLWGNALQNKLETEFVPRLGVPNDAVMAFNDMYIADRDLGTWNKAKKLMIRAGLIMRGSTELFMDYSEDPQGRINLRYTNHNRVQYDPDWTTDNIADNKHIIHWAWMDPQEISRTWNKKTPEIESAIELWKQQVPTRSTDYLELDSSLKYSSTPEFVDILNGRFLVAQISRLDQVPRDQLYDMDKGEFLPEMSPENMQAMMGLKGGRLKVLKNTVAVTKINTIVPGLSTNLMLEDDSPHEVQIGNYPYFTWSYLNVNGEPQGVMDVGKDIQQIYNKRESTFTHWQTTAANGAEFVEEDFFADPKEKSRYIDEKNIPGSTFTVTSGSISRGKMGIGTRPREGVPNDLHTSADRALGMADSVMPATPALSGGEGKSGESGKLFREKKAQALVSLEATMTTGIEEFEHEFANAYFRLGKMVYSGAPRQVYNKESKSTILLNIPTQTGAIINDIASIGRLDVRISKSKRGDSMRMELLDRYVEVVQFVQNPVLKAFVEKQMITVLPNIPDKDVEEALQLAEKFEKLQDSRIGNEIIQNMLGIATGEQQLQQINNPEPPPQPGGQPQLEGGPPAPNPNSQPQNGGGLSVEGKSMKPGEVVPADVKTVNQLQ